MVLVKNFSDKKEESFEDLIARGLTGYEYTESRNGRVYASDALCELKGTYDGFFEGEELETPEKYHFIKGGITSEEITKWSLKETGNLLFDEYKLPDVGINLGGRVDGIVHWRDKLWVAEFKQIGSIPSSPKKEHISQTMVYSAITGLPGLIYYVDRKVITPFPMDFSHRAFALESNYENRFKYLSRVVKINLYSNRKLFPSKPLYMKKSWCPNHCKLIDYCWNKGDFPETETMLDFEDATPRQEQEIEEQGNEITRQLLNEQVLKDRFKGVLNFIARESKHKIAKDLLHGKDWDGYFCY